MKEGAFLVVFHIRILYNTPAYLAAKVVPRFMANEHSKLQMIGILYILRFAFVLLDSSARTHIRGQFSPEAGVWGELEGSQPASPTSRRSVRRLRGIPLARAKSRVARSYPYFPPEKATRPGKIGESLRGWFRFSFRHVRSELPTP